MQTKLTQKLGQRLALTPQLTQSLKVLAMNTVELETYIEDCLETNPLLEKTQEQEKPESNAVEKEVELPKSEAEKLQEQDAWRESGDDRWESMYSNSPGSSYDDFSNREQQWHEEQSLSESLHEQINHEPMESDVRTIAHALVDSLDDDGYFRADPAELEAQFGVDRHKLIAVLEDIVQELEPSGIGARSLSECLLLQLNDDEAATRLARRLLLHFSEHLTDEDKKLASLAGCDIEELAAARVRMRRLDPFPGHGLRGENNIYIRPEVIFRRMADGSIQIEVPNYSWRGVRLNEQWQDHQFTGTDREFMDSAMKEAKWLLYALDQRRETLYKVAHCLAKRQRGFLDHGVLGLKPLTLQNVAEEVGLHESTISRVTNGKYAQTPLGLIEMRQFFSSGLPTRGGGTISVYRVQQRVKSLIESEPVGRPISDQAIADRLQAEGIEVARRTVAKYREGLGLPPSSHRRRQTRRI